MTPKEKAKELINKYLQVYDGRVIQAKQCALLAVDEILEIFEDTNGCDYRLEYWQEVKQELENL